MIYVGDSPTVHLIVFGYLRIGHAITDELKDVDELVCAEFARTKHSAFEPCILDVVKRRTKEQMAGSYAGFVVATVAGKDV